MIRGVPGAQKLYYKKDQDVAEDAELQAWWAEIRTKGHPDADPAGWPDSCRDGIGTVADLSDITTTMAWMGSAHHAAGAGDVHDSGRAEVQGSLQSVPHAAPLMVIEWCPAAQCSVIPMAFCGRRALCSAS